MLRRRVLKLVLLLLAASILLCSFSEGDSLPVTRFSQLSRLRSTQGHHLQNERVARIVLFSSSKNPSRLLSRNKILLGLGGAVVTLVPAVELYSRSGSRDYPEDFLSRPKNGGWENIEYATIVFHGSGGQDQYTDALMKKLEDSATSKSTHSSMVEWSRFSTNIFQASFNAQRIGKLVASQLVEKAPKLKTIHFIGISVGSFAADAATTEMRAKTGSISAPYIQLTLLDPFTQRGIFDFGYGNRSFGKSADYTEQYLNTDDPVPSTNSPLQYCGCYDITKLRPEEIFGHDWPVAYYAKYGNPSIRNPEKRLERGSVVTLEN